MSNLKYKVYAVWDIDENKTPIALRGRFNSNESANVCQAHCLKENIKTIIDTFDIDVKEADSKPDFWF